MVTSALLLSLFACESQYVIDDATGDVASDGGKDDPVVEEDTAPDYSEFDGATLVVTAPSSGAFLPYGDVSTFSAEVRGADGTVLAFDDIAWSSDVDAAWLLAGAAVEDDGLDVGTHALTAVADLPNGDRLAYTIGGVLVQSAYTGIYTGTLQVDATAEYDGTAYTAGCSGAITLVVDSYGETVEGDAGCLLSLLGYDLDTAYIFDLANDGGTLSGDAALDLSFYQLDIAASGEITEEGAATVDFSDDVYGFALLDGHVDVTRLTRDISAYSGE
ncbi:MAG: hypothetical protein Q8P18_34775 [Pseudomonadota bacterium]|nr:hypothetical protein [Pseudomonadota bacterium]